MDDPKKSIWTFFIGKGPVTWLVILGVLIMGSVSLSSLPMELQPEVTIPYGMVHTAMPGANPADVETLLTKPLEKEISTVADVKTLTSTSSLGFSSIFVEFEADAVDKAIEDLKDAVDRVKPKLPEDASDPVVIQTEANSMSIISFSFMSDRPMDELTDVAEEIQTELEKIPGVSRVALIGGQERHVEILLDRAKVDAYGLNIRDVANIIEFSNPNVPVGVVSSDRLNYSVRIDGAYQSIDDIRNIPLFVFPDEGKTSVLLRDVAKVSEALPVAMTGSKLSVGGEKSLRAVSLQIFKKDGANIIDLAEAARARVDELSETLLPDDVEVAVSNDNSVFVEADLGILTSNGLQTTILIVVILFLALGFTEGLLAGLSIPLSLLFGFIIMDIEGMTLNGLSVFSLVIALGLMVDTAIVIMEGIHLNMREGMSSEDAAINSVQTYKYPLIAGTLTTIFAFFPMLLVSGILGEFLSTLPITISAVLGGSLLLSLTIVPAVAASLLKNRKTVGRVGILEPLFNWMGRFFSGMIAAILHRGFLRMMVVLVTFIAFVGSLALPITGILQTEMFPKTDFRFFTISIETPNGTVLEETEKVVEKVEASLYEVPEIENFLTIVGTDQGQVDFELVSAGGTEDSNLANITVNIVEEEKRDRKSYAIAADLREEFENFTEGKVVVEEVQEGPPSDAPITVRITGDNVDVLEKIMSDVETVVRGIEGTLNVRNSLEVGLGEFKFVLDRDKVAYHGLSLPNVAMLVRTAIQGVVLDDVSVGGEEKNLVLKYDLPQHDGRVNLSIKDIENVSIGTPGGYSVSLAELGSYDFGESLASIDREDQKRIVKVRSDVAAGASVIALTAEVQEKLASIELPSGYDLELAGDTEAIDESFADLYRSMGVGIILIGFTLVLMFNSLRQPFIILLTLPMALIGVFPGLLLIGLKLSFPAFLGVVALTGVVVNDAIVLIDKINRNRADGMKFRDSIAEAAESRLQPIIMTSITTIVGIVPLALTNEFWAGLGFSLVFGLAFSTILTLIVIPVLYHMFEGRRARKRGEF